MDDFNLNVIVYLNDRLYSVWFKNGHFKGRLNLTLGVLVLCSLLLDTFSVNSQGSQTFKHENSLTSKQTCDVNYQTLELTLRGR